MHDGCHGEYRILLDSGEKHTGAGPANYAGMPAQTPSKERREDRFSRCDRSGSPSPARVADRKLYAGARSCGTARPDAPAQETAGAPEERENRIQKVLETASVKMGNVVSDVFGVSGQEIPRALLENLPLSAEQMAEMAKKRLRQKIPQLTEALEGQQMNDHHRWLIEQSVEHAKFLDRQVEEPEKKIDLQLEPYHGQYELLMTIPGIKEAAAFNILAEIGPNMQQFPTADQLCSWAGICPGNNRSAGKSKSSHIKKANKFLLAALVESSWGTARQEGSVFQRKFRRWVKKGEKKAVIAACRCLLRVIWSVLRNDRPYVEPDAKVLQHLERQKQVRYHTQRLRELGADDQTRAYITRMGFGKGPTKSGLSYGLYCRRIKSWPLLLLLLSHPACAISPPAW